MREGSCIADVVEGRADWIIIHGQCVGSDPRPEWGAHDVLAGMPDGCVDHVIADPPYSAHVHASVRSGKRNRGLVAGDGAAYGCNVRRTVDLGFSHLGSNLRRSVAAECARLVRRWSLLFCDMESAWLWRLSLTANDLKHHKTMGWVRIGGAPNFTGTGPAAGIEAIATAHPPGRSRWNGGGKAGVYQFPIVLNRLGQRDSRVHPTQKPLDLMVALVDDFTDPGELILDPFAGSGTTGVACLMRGRRFIGIERDPVHVETARRRLRETQQGLVIAKTRPKQKELF